MSLNRYAARLRARWQARELRDVKQRMRMQMVLIGGRALDPSDEDLWANHLLRIVQTWPWSLGVLVDTWTIWWTWSEPRGAFADLLMVAAASGDTPVGKAHELTRLRRRIELDGDHP